MVAWLLSAVRFGKTGRTAATYLLLAGLQRGVSLLILPFISHAMTPIEYGAASILTVSALLFATILAAPLEQLVFRASARGGTDAPALIRTAGTYCYLILPVIAAIGSGAFALLVPELFGVAGIIWGIEILAIGFLPAATYFALPMVRARQDLKKFVVLALGSVLVIGLSKLSLIVILNLGVLGWAISDLVSGVISAALAMALVRRPDAQITTGVIRAALSFSVPLIPHRASFWALQSLSRPAMAAVSTLAQVGLLSFGLNLASIANLALAEINQAVLPRYSRESLPAPSNETLGPVRWQLVASFIVPAVVGAVLALAGQSLFAEAYWPSFALTGILLIGQAAYGLYLIPMNFLVQTAGLPKYSSLASFSGALVIFSGILAFGHDLGASGVACATAAGFVMMAVIAVALSRMLKLNIRWRSWIGAWPEVAISIISLVATVASLLLPASSAPAYGLAVTSLVLICTAVAVASRRTQRQR